MSKRLREAHTQKKKEKISPRRRKIGKRVHTHKRQDFKKDFLELGTRSKKSCDCEFNEPEKIIKRTCIIKKEFEAANSL